MPQRPKLEEAWLKWYATKYSVCRLNIFFEHVLKLPGPSNPYRALGKALHYQFKRFFTPHVTTRRYPYRELEAFLGVWKHFWWSAVAGKHGFGSLREPPETIDWNNDRDLPGAMFGWGHEMIKQFHQTFVDERERPGVGYWNERRFRFPWHGFTLSGVVDRLDLEPEGAVVIDYKLKDLPRPILNTGIQLTIYQLAYEKVFRPKLAGHPPLKALRIYNYNRGCWQTAQLRKPEEFGKLFLALTALGTYFQSILTGLPPHRSTLAHLESRELDDIAKGDVSPLLPRGEHCTYCRHLEACQLWEQGKRPLAREAFREKFAGQIDALHPTQIRIPYDAITLVVEEAAAFTAQRATLATLWEQGALDL